MLGGIFHFDSNFKRTFCKQTVDTLIRRRVEASGLGLHCLSRSHKKDARLIWVKIYAIVFFVLLHLQGMYKIRNLCDFKLCTLNVFSKQSFNNPLNICNRS